MPTVLGLSFPGGRYHANPWGHHVNEGQVEWPPSPWRLLRALLATGFQKLGWEAAQPPALARALIASLAAELPSYSLPRIALAHTRHYVDAAGKRPLILDTWAQLGEGRVEVTWPVELPEDQRALLGELARLLGYLGRAESWVEGRLLGEPTLGGFRCMPDKGGPPGPAFERVRVLAPITPEQYAAWRGAQVATIEAEHAVAPGRKRTANQQKKYDQALAPYARDLVQALCVETGDLQAQGWSAAPGSQEATYWRHRDAMAVGPPHRPRQVSAPPVELALLSLTTPSRGESALPPLQRVFPQGRLLHRALSSVIGKQFGGQGDLALALLGRDGDGRALGDHQHAHLLHLNLGGERLDHVLVYVPMGLSGACQEVLRSLHHTYMKGGVGELQVALAGVGDAGVMRTAPHPGSGVLRRLLGPPEGAHRWVSRTPYVAPRMLKERGRDSLVGLVTAECARRGLPAPVAVRVVPRGEEQAVAPAGETGMRAMRHYVLHDQRHEPPFRVVWCLELRFDEPVSGPLCLGYGAHFGLGQFAAAG